MSEEDAKPGEVVKQHSEVMLDIEDMGHSEHNTATAKVVTSHPTTRKSNRLKGHGVAGIFRMRANKDGTLSEDWDDYFPRPPSMTDVKDPDNPNDEHVAIFNANTEEGFTMVHILSEKQIRVVAAVRVFTSKKTRALMDLPFVTVKVADATDVNSLFHVAEGCSKAYVVTKFWEKFESKLEEQMAMNILEACAKEGIRHLALASFENTSDLRLRGLKSQLRPTKDGRIFPQFKGKKMIDDIAKTYNPPIQITHTLTSFMDKDDEKKSVILIRGDNGRVIVEPYQVPPKPKQEPEEEDKKEDDMDSGEPQHTEEYSEEFVEEFAEPSEEFGHTIPEESVVQSAA